MEDYVRELLDERKKVQEFYNRGIISFDQGVHMDTEAFDKFSLGMKVNLSIHGTFIEKSIEIEDVKFFALYRAEELDNNELLSVLKNRKKGD